MAILNYALELTDALILRYLDPNISADDRLSLIFTGDKHIITHGIDLLSNYENGVKGLVPSYPTEGDWSLGKTGWLELILNLHNVSETTPTSAIASAKAIKEFIASSIAANDLMSYKGVIKIEGNVITTNTTLGFPSSARLGDAYRLLVNNNTNNITIADSLPQTADIILCVSAYNNLSMPEAASNTHWLYLDTNIKGTTSIKINGSTIKVLSDSTASVEFYVPTSSGVSGLILGSNGNSPTWVTPSLGINNGKISANFGGDSIFLDIPIAKVSELGLVKVYGELSNRDITDVTTLSILDSDPLPTKNLYGVQVDKTGKAFVYVPLLEYQEVSNKNSGIAPIIPTSADTINDISLEWVLTTTLDVNGNRFAKWKMLPLLIKTTDTWRDIFVKNTSLGNYEAGIALNITELENDSILMVYHYDEDHKILSVGFELMWFNLDTGEYESSQSDFVQIK